MSSSVQPWENADLCAVSVVPGPDGLCEEPRKNGAKSGAAMLALLPLQLATGAPERAPAASGVRAFGYTSFVVDPPDGQIDLFVMTGTAVSYARELGGGR
jgi:hypothetical protein